MCKLFICETKPFAEGFGWGMSILKHNVKVQENNEKSDWNEDGIAC